MTIYDYLESLDMDFTAKARLFSIITGRNKKENITFSHYMNYSRQNEMPEDFIIPQENLLDLMTEVNRMVKDPSCPNNIRNRFYNQKKSVLRKMVQTGRVSDIWGEGDYYAMLADGKYPFHQPKPYFAHMDFEVEGERPYVPGDDPAPFDAKTYRDFEILYYVFTGRFRHTKAGYAQDPNHYSGKKYKKYKEEQSA